MKTDISKSQAQIKINDFFARKEFTAEEVRKIKRLAMKFKIRLGGHRRKFCKQCLAKLDGSTRVRGENKTIICGFCGFTNRIKMNQKM